MSVAGIDKITLFFPASARERAMRIIHDMACVEAIPGGVSSASGAELVSPEKLSARLDALRSAIDVITRAAEGCSAVAAGPSPRAKVRLSREDASVLAENFKFERICAEAAMFSRSAVEADASARLCETEAARLEPWKDVGAKLSELSDGAAIRFFAGQMSSPRSKEFFAALGKYPHHSAVVSDDGKIISFGMAYPAAFIAEISALVRKFAVTHVPYSSSDETPAAVLARLRAALAGHERRAARRREKLAGLSPHLPRLKALYDILLESKTLADSAKILFSAGRINYFTGWILRKNVPSIEAALKKSGVDYHIITRPAADGDDAPVVLENKKTFEPFEVVTDLYGKPAYTESDPTPWVAPFFAAFFGICMADALYGVLITAAGLAGIRYSASASARKFMKLVVYCGAATAIFGVMTGGYFGNLIDRFELFAFARPLKSALKVFDPLDKSIEFLAGCLVIGFFQTMLGSVLKLVADVRERNWREAVLADVAVIGIQASFPLLIIGELFGAKIAPTSFLLVALGISSAALMVNQWIVNEGVVLKIFQMFFSVYGAITGNALSDILSYSRLFALGLSTALLAMVLNEVAALLFSSAIGIPFGILVLLLFHPFILLIGSLGAYVHTSRLQYLEFFNKFFRGGGREMRPLRWVRKYTV